MVVDMLVEEMVCIKRKKDYKAKNVLIYLFPIHTVYSANLSTAIFDYHFYSYDHFLKYWNA